MRPGLIATPAVALLLASCGTAAAPAAPFDPPEARSPATSAEPQVTIYEPPT